MNVKNKKVLIFGLGRYVDGSGISAAHFFVRRGARVVVTDKKSARELDKSVKRLRGKVKFHLGGHRMSDIRDADIVVRNPGVPSDSPYIKAARKAGIPVMTDISIFMQLCPCPILGVTGTRGKSTTTALLGEMVRRVNKKTFVGGNIQRSPLTFLDKLEEKSMVVLELSSWMLESLKDIRQSPWGVVVTNIYPDHLNIHRSLGEYVRSKERIFQYQKPGDILVLNRDDVTTRDMMRRRPKGVLVRWFSTRPLAKTAKGACMKNGWIVVGGKRALPVIKMKLQGAHNIANALAASALAYAVGVPVQKIALGLQAFSGLANRQEIIKKQGGITWVNDTTATSPEAAMAALERFGEDGKRIILIAGGADKKFRPAQFQTFARVMKKYCKAALFLPGTATTKLKKYTSGELVKDMQVAVTEAKNLARRGDTIVLSPGAASFGLFQNEFDRGEQFKKYVHALK
jgi:UDP-N-acetylmuramoylalanine--D-glutamate ligase